MVKIAKLKKKMKQSAAKPKAPWKIILLGSIKALFITLLILLLLSFLITYSRLPEKIVPMFTTVLSIVAVLLASKRVCKKIGKKGWINGALTGLSYMFMMAILGTVFTSMSPLTFFISYWPLLVSGVVGGIWGV